MSKEFIPEQQVEFPEKEAKGTFDKENIYKLILEAEEQPRIQDQLSEEQQQQFADLKL